MRLSNGPAGPSGEADINSNALNISSNVSGINSTLLNDNSTLKINSTLLTIDNFLNISFSILKTVFPLLFILFLVPSASAQGYTLEEATTNITIDPNGIVHIEESVSYTFDRNYTYVYRVINTSAEESIRNIEGYCSDNACKFRVETTPEGYKLIGELPETAPKNLTFFISYDHYGAVIVHNDVSEFQKLWGDEWERPLGSLKGSITFPVKNGSEIRYWTHPPVYTQEETIKHNVLNLKTKEIPPSHRYEVRAVFPRIESPNSSFVQVDNSEKLEEILAIENEYQRKESILESLYRIAGYFLLFVLIFPLVIYSVYGRGLKTGQEKKTYAKINEKEKTDPEEKHKRELPANFRPAVVNAIMMGKLGIPTMDGFTATFMDLVNRGYISLRNLQPEEIGLPQNPEFEPVDFMIELNPDIYSQNKENLSELADFEEDVLYLFKRYAPEGKVSWRKLRTEFENGTYFYRFINVWNKKVQAHTGIDRFFQSTGNKYMNRFSKGIFIVAIVCYFAISGYFPSEEFPQVSKVSALTALIGILGFIMIKSSGMLVQTFGHWTPEGNACYERWDNFKEYLTDLSALKEYPPESIKVWDSYLIYATSLGVAKQVFQNMPRIVSFDQLKESCFYPVISVYNQPGYGPGDTRSSYSKDGDGEGKDRNQDIRVSNENRGRKSSNTGNGSTSDGSSAE